MQDGITPLQLSVSSGFLPVAKFLIEECGAEVNEYSDTGFTALHVACDRDMADMANYLVGQGANLNAKDAKGRTPVDVCGSIGLDQLEVWENDGSNSNVCTLNTPGNVESSNRSDSYTSVAADNHKQRNLSIISPSGIDYISPQKENVRGRLDPIDCSASSIESITSPSELSVHQKIMDLNKRSGRKPMPQSLLSEIRRPQRRATTSNHYREQYEASIHESEKSRRSSSSHSIIVGPLSIRDEDSRQLSVSSEDFKRRGPFKIWEKLVDENDSRKEFDSERNRGVSTANGSSGEKRRQDTFKSIGSVTSMEAFENFESVRKSSTSSSPIPFSPITRMPEVSPRVLTTSPLRHSRTQISPTGSSSVDSRRSGTVLFADNGKRGKREEEIAYTSPLLGGGNGFVSEGRDSDDSVDDPLGPPREDSDGRRVSVESATVVASIDDRSAMQSTERAGSSAAEERSFYNDDSTGISELLEAKGRKEEAMRTIATNTSFSRTGSSESKSPGTHEVSDVKSSSATADSVGAVSESAPSVTAAELVTGALVAAGIAAGPPSSACTIFVATATAATSTGTETETSTKGDGHGTVSVSVDASTTPAPVATSVLAPSVVTASSAAGIITGSSRSDRIASVATATTSTSTATETDINGDEDEHGCRAISVSVGASAGAPVTVVVVAAPSAVASSVVPPSVAVAPRAATVARLGAGAAGIVTGSSSSAGIASVATTTTSTSTATETEIFDDDADDCTPSAVSVSAGPSTTPAPVAPSVVAAPASVTVTSVAAAKTANASSGNVSGDIVTGSSPSASAVSIATAATTTSIATETETVTVTDGDGHGRRAISVSVDTSSRAPLAVAPVMPPPVAIAQVAPSVVARIAASGAAAAPLGLAAAEIADGPPSSVRTVSVATATTSTSTATETDIDGDEDEHGPVSVVAAAGAPVSVAPVVSISAVVSSVVLAPVAVSPVAPRAATVARLVAGAAGIVTGSSPSDRITSVATATTSTSTATETDINGDKDEHSSLSVTPSAAVPSALGAGPAGVVTGSSSSAHTVSIETAATSTSTAAETETETDAYRDDHGLDSTSVSVGESARAPVGQLISAPAPVAASRAADAPLGAGAAGVITGSSPSDRISSVATTTTSTSTATETDINGDKDEHSSLSVAPSAAVPSVVPAPVSVAVVAAPSVVAPSMVAPVAVAVVAAPSAAAPSIVPAPVPVAVVAAPSAVAPVVPAPVAIAVAVVAAPSAAAVAPFGAGEGAANIAAGPPSSARTVSIATTTTSTSTATETVTAINGDRDGDDHAHGALPVSVGTSARAPIAIVAAPSAVVSPVVPAPVAATPVTVAPVVVAQVAASRAADTPSGAGASGTEASSSARIVSVATATEAHINGDEDDHSRVAVPVPGGTSPRAPVAVAQSAGVAPSAVVAPSLLPVPVISIAPAAVTPVVSLGTAAARSGLPSSARTTSPVTTSTSAATETDIDADEDDRIVLPGVTAVVGADPIPFSTATSPAPSRIEGGSKASRSTALHQQEQPGGTLSSSLSSSTYDDLIFGTNPMARLSKAPKPVAISKMVGSQVAALSLRAESSQAGINAAASGKVGGSHPHPHLDGYLTADTISYGSGTNGFLSSVSSDIEYRGRTEPLKLSSFSEDEADIAPSASIPLLPFSQPLESYSDEDDSGEDFPVMSLSETFRASQRDSFKEVVARHELLASAAASPHMRSVGLPDRPVVGSPTLNTRHRSTQYANGKERKTRTLSYILGSTNGSNIGSDSDGESISSGWSWAAARPAASVELQIEALEGLQRTDSTNFNIDDENEASQASDVEEQRMTDPVSAVPSRAADPVASTGAAPSVRVASVAVSGLVPTPLVTAAIGATRGADEISARAASETSAAGPVLEPAVKISSTVANCAAASGTGTAGTGRAPASGVTSSSVIDTASGPAVAATSIVKSPSTPPVAATAAGGAAFASSASVIGAASGPAITVSSTATDGAVPTTTATSATGPATAACVTASSAAKSGVALVSAVADASSAASMPAATSASVSGTATAIAVSSPSPPARGAASSVIVGSSTGPLSGDTTTTTSATAASPLPGVTNASVSGSVFATPVAVTATANARSTASATSASVSGAAPAMIVNSASAVSNVTVASASAHGISASATGAVLAPAVRVQVTSSPPPPVTVSSTSSTRAVLLSTVTSTASPLLGSGLSSSSMVTNSAAPVAMATSTVGPAPATGVSESSTARSGAVPATAMSGTVLASAAAVTTIVAPLPAVVSASVSGTVPAATVSTVTVAVPAPAITVSSAAQSRHPPAVPVAANTSAAPASGVTPASVNSPVPAVNVSPQTSGASPATVRATVTTGAASVASALSSAGPTLVPAPPVTVSSTCASAASTGPTPAPGVTLSSTAATAAAPVVTVSSNLTISRPEFAISAVQPDEDIQDRHPHSDHVDDLPDTAMSSILNPVTGPSPQSQPSNGDKSLGANRFYEATGKQILPLNESNQSKIDGPAIPYLLAEIRAGDEMKAELLDRIALLEAQTIELQKMAQSASAAAIIAAQQLEEETKKHIMDMSSFSEDAERRSVQKDHDNETLVVQLAIARKILCQAGEDAKASAADRQDLEHRALLAMGQLEEHLKREGEARLAAEDKLRAIEEETQDIMSPKKVKDDTDVPFLSPSHEPLPAQLLAASLPSLRAIATTPSTLPSLLTLYKNLGEVLQEQAGDGAVRPPRVPMCVGTAAATAQTDRAARLGATGLKSDRDVLLSFDNIYPTLESSCPSEASSARTISPDTVGHEGQAFETVIPKLHLPPPRAASPITLSGSLINGEGRRGSKEDKRDSLGDGGHKEEARVGCAPSRADPAPACVDSILFIEDNPIVSGTRRFSIRKMTGAEQTEIEDQLLDIARQDRQKQQRLEMLDFESIYYAEEKPISTSGTPEQRPERRRGQKEAQKVNDIEGEVKEKEEKDKERTLKVGVSQDINRRESISSDATYPPPLFVTASRSSPERRGNLKNKVLFADSSVSSQGAEAERAAGMGVADSHHTPPRMNVAPKVHVNLDETLLPGPEELWSVPRSLTAMERNHIDRLREEAESMDALDATLLDTHAINHRITPTLDITTLDLSDLEFEAIQNQDSLGYEEENSTDAERSFCMEDLFLLGNQPVTMAQGVVPPSPIRGDEEAGLDSSPRSGNLSGFFQEVSRSPERRGRLKREGKERGPSVDANLCSPSSTPERIGAPVLEEFTFAEETSLSRRPLHGRTGHHSKHSSPHKEEQEKEGKALVAKVQELHRGPLSLPVMDCLKGTISAHSADTTCATVDSPLAATSSALTPLDIGDGDSDCEVDMGPGTGSVRNLFQHESYSESEKTDVECAATISPRPSNNMSHRGKVVDEKPVSRAERMVMLKLEWSVGSILTVFRTLAERVRAAELARPHSCSLLQRTDSSRMAEAFRRFKCHRLSTREMLVSGPIHSTAQPLLDANEAPLKVIFQRYCPMRRSEDSSRQRRACRHLSATQTLNLLSEFELQPHVTR
jgi:Ankyrin repeats (3 copies)